MKISLCTTRRIMLILAVLLAAFALAACGAQSPVTDANSVMKQAPIPTPVPTTQACTMPTDGYQYEPFDKIKANVYKFGEDLAGDYIASQVWEPGPHLLTVQNKFTNEFRGLPINVCPTGEIYMYLPGG